MAAEKSADQRALDIWASGYMSGAMTVYCHALGMSSEMAHGIVRGQIGDMARDPLVTAELLEKLALLETAESLEDLPAPTTVKIHRAD